MLIALSILSCQSVTQVRVRGRQKVVPVMGTRTTGRTMCMSVWDEVGKKAALQLKEVCAEVKFSW